MFRNVYDLINFFSIDNEKIVGEVVGVVKLPMPHLTLRIIGQETSFTATAKRTIGDRKVLIERQYHN